MEPASDSKGCPKRAAGQFAVAALYERRNLLNQNPAVIDRRYRKAKVHHYPQACFLARGPEIL